MVELAAVEEEAFPQRPGMEQEQRIVQEPGEKGRFNETEWRALVHDSNSTIP